MCGRVAWSIHSTPISYTGEPIGGFEIHFMNGSQLCFVFERNIAAISDRRSDVNDSAYLDRVKCADTLFNRVVWMARMVLCTRVNDSVCCRTVIACVKECILYYYYLIFRNHLLLTDFMQSYL